MTGWPSRTGPKGKNDVGTLKAVKFLFMGPLILCSSRSST